MTEPMRNPEQYHRGPCPVPTPTERERVAKILRAMRVKIALARLDDIVRMG